MRNWQKLKKVDWKKWGQLSLLSAFFFLLGLTLNIYYPQFKGWAIYQISETTAKNFGIQVLPRDIRLTLFPLGIKLVDLRVHALHEMKKDFPKIMVKEISTSLDMFAVLSGRLRLSSLNIIEPNIIYMQKAAKKAKSQSFDFSIRQLNYFPISRLRIENLNLETRLPDIDTQAKIKGLNINLENRDGSLNFDILAPDFYWKQLSTDFDVKAAALLRGYVNRNEVHVDRLQVHQGHSQIIAKGNVSGKIEEFLIHEVEVESKIHGQLPELQALAHKVFPDKKIPKADGVVDFISLTKYSNAAGPEVQFIAKTQKLSIDKFIIDNIETRGVYKQKKFQLSQFYVKNDSGNFGVKDTQVIIDDSNRVLVKAQADVKEFELQKFLNNIGLKEIPTILHLKAGLGCDGEAWPSLNLTCKGEVTGKNLHVYVGDNKKHKIFNIVKVPDLQATGEVKITLKDVSYSANLKIKDYLGSSKGNIQYDRGFKIFFNTPQLDFSTLDYFVGLKFAGKAKLNGYTEGDAHHAIIETDASLTQFSLEDFWLGDVDTHFSYKNEHLKFNNLIGRVDSSNYAGNIEIGLSPPTLTVNAKSQDLNLKDLSQVLEKKIKLPFEVSGYGRTQVQVQGPLDVHHLSFKVSSHFSDGKIAGENFDNLTANFIADNGTIKSNKILLTKNASQISVSGSMAPDGNLDVAVTGDQLRLEDSQYIKSGLQELRGQMDFDLSLKGPITRPNTQFKGYLSQMILASEPMESSTFTLDFKENSISGKGTFFGSRVSSQFDIPMSNESPFRLYVNAKEWNFLPLVGLLLKNERQWDYKSSLSGLLELKSSKGGFWKSTGKANIDALSIQRGTITLTSENPFKVTFDQGVINSNMLNLKGTNSFFRASATNMTRDNLNINSSAKIDLSLLSLLTPFLKEIRGQLTLSLKVHDSIDHPNVLGSAYVDNGVLKLPEFAQTFQNIKSDVLFNNKKILINSFRANLGGGFAQASGAVSLGESKGLAAIDISGAFDQVHLNIPEGVKSFSSGTLNLTGNSFPYKLAVKATVDGGEVTREFESEDKSSAGFIKQSTFLPKLIVEKEFKPIVLQLSLFLGEGIKIKNSRMDTNINGQLQVNGEPNSPQIVGQVNLLKGGKIMFKNTPFEVSTAQIRFRENAANNPDLYILATARVQEEYDITLLVQGNGQKPVFQLTSQPSLTEPEIICLLALGLTCDKLEKSVASTQQGQASSYQIGAAFLSQNPLGKQIKDRYGVDVGFSTAFESDNSSVPQITVGKQLSNQLGVKAIRSFGKESKMDTQIFYNINKNWSFIGSWEGKEEETNSTDKTTNKNSNNSVGVDLEYKVEFK